MYSRVETITPEIAKEYLKHNLNNRNPKLRAIEKYARDMKNGEWQFTPQGISFFENGNLADGQNRLLAVIRAGIPVDFYVTYDVPNESTIQDRGVSRSVPDILRMSGMSSSAATSNGVALSNFLFGMTGRMSVSDQTIMAFTEDNEQDICDALLASSRGVGENGTLAKKAPITAAAFCALRCGIPVDCLTRFFTVVNSGFCEKREETPAVVLRNFLLNSYTGALFENRKIAFYTALNAIRDFANGIPRTKKYSIQQKPAFWPYVKKIVEKHLADYKKD